MLFVHDLRKILLQSAEGLAIVSMAHGNYDKNIEYKRIGDEIYIATEVPINVTDNSLIDLLTAIGFQEVRKSEKAIWMKIHRRELEQVSTSAIRVALVEAGYDIEK